MKKGGMSDRDMLHKLRLFETTQMQAWLMRRRLGGDSAEDIIQELTTQVVEARVQSVRQQVNRARDKRSQIKSEVLHEDLDLPNGASEAVSPPLDPGAFKVGDKVKVVKPGSCIGQKAVVLDPDWQNRIKVQMVDGGDIKSYLANDDGTPEIVLVEEHSGETTKKELALPIVDAGSKPDKEIDSKHKVGPGSQSKDTNEEEMAGKKQDEKADRQPRMAKRNFSRLEVKRAISRAVDFGSFKSIASELMSPRLGLRHRSGSSGASTGSDSRDDKFEVGDLKKKLKIKVFKSRADTDSNLQHAGCYMNDAFHGRLKNGLGSVFDKPAIQRIAFKIHMQPWYKRGLKSLGLLLLVLVFFEPSSYVAAQRGEYNDLEVSAAKVVELCILLLLFTDYILRLTYMGWKKLNEKYWIRMLMHVEILLILDCMVAIIVGTSSVRVFRFMRPYVYTLLDKPTLQLTRQCFKAAMELRNIGALMLLIVFVFSIFASALVSERLWMDSDADWDFDWRPFQDVQRSMTPLFSLITVEAYPEIIKPMTLLVPELSILFIVLIAMCTYTLLNFAVAIQVHGFKRELKGTSAKEEKKLINTFVAVFYLARDETSKRVSLNNFCRLIKIHKPRIKRQFVEEMYMAIAPDEDHESAQGLDLASFLKLPDVLRSSEMSNHEHYNLNWFFNLYFEAKIALTDLITRDPGQKPTRFTRLLARHMKTGDYVFLGINMINMVLLASIHESSNEGWSQTVLYIDRILFGVFIIECMLQVWLVSLASWLEDAWNRYKLYNIIFTLLLLVLEANGALDFWLVERLLLMHPRRTVHKITGALRSMVAVQLNKNMRDMFVVVVRSLPVIKEFSVVLFVFMYQNGILSMEILYQSSSFQDPRTMIITQLTMLQFDGWQNHLYTMQTECTSWKLYAAITLVYLFITFCQYILLSQLMATMYDIYLQHQKSIIAEIKGSGKGAKKEDYEKKHSVDKGQKSDKDGEKPKKDEEKKAEKEESKKTSVNPDDNSTVEDTMSPRLTDVAQRIIDGKRKSKHWRGQMYASEESARTLQLHTMGSMIEAQKSNKTVPAKQASKGKVQPTLKHTKSKEEIKSRFEKARKSGHWRRDLHGEAVGKETIANQFDT